VAIGLDKVLHLFPLEPAVPSGAQAIDGKKPLIRPPPHCVGMNMEQVSHLSGGQHP